LADRTAHVTRSPESSHDSAWRRIAVGRNGRGQSRNLVCPRASGVPAIPGPEGLGGTRPLPRKAAVHPAGPARHPEASITDRLRTRRPRCLREHAQPALDRRDGRKPCGHPARAIPTPGWPVNTRPSSGRERARGGCARSSGPVRSAPESGRSPSSAADR
jgi:hypothetical protein